MKMRLIVDRVEGQFAVCEAEEKRMAKIPLSEFDFIPHDGDVIEYEDHRVRKLSEETRQRKQAADDLFQKLLKRQ